MLSMSRTIVLVFTSVQYEQDNSACVYKQDKSEEYHSACGYK